MVARRAQENGHAAEQASERLGNRVHEQAQRPHAHGHAQLEPGEEADGVLVPVDEGGDHAAAQEDPEEEAGEHRGEGVDGGAEADQQDSRPHDLEGEGGEARDADRDQRRAGDAASRLRRDARQGVEILGPRPRRAFGELRSKPDRGADPPDRQVHRRGAERGCGHPQVGQQDEADRQRAEQGSQGVHGVEVRGEPPEHAAGAHEVLHDERQRGPHDRRWDQQRAAREQHPQQLVEPEPSLLALRIEGLEQRGEGREQLREAERERADAELRDPVPQERAARVLGQAATEQAAEREPGHEGAQDDRDAVHVASEEETERPHPDHLVGEAGRAREKEQGRDQCEANRRNFLTHGDDSNL